MMVNTKFLQIIAKLIAFLCLLMHVHVLCDGGFNTQFIASEAEALLEFKDGLKDPSNLLSSWTLGKDCCHWKGVGCNTTTDSFGSLKSLHMLVMRNNNLSGKIPDTLKNCQVMTFLELGSNRFRGPIPFWIGAEMQILKILSLRKNLFKENIPTTLCQLKSLLVLDLAENKLTGAIPRCVFPAMTTEESINEKSYMEILTIKESISDYLYRTGNGGFRLIKSIDLSSNFLAQGIPVEMVKLVELLSLNLSRNQLVGSIPSSIGEMQNLESLDLSRNQLSCAIPTTMIDMEFLAHLNLSYNTLSGEIPSDGQFATFVNDSYLGNPRLCGFSVTKACPKSGNISLEDAYCRENEGKIEHENDDYHEENGINPLYITMAAGFFTGFWAFWGSLIFVASWRHAYFRFLSNMNDRIYVIVVVAYNKLQRKLHAQEPPM